MHNPRCQNKEAERIHVLRNATGERRIILGSTSKMGTGTNIQNKLVALHHLDCPWRPADIEQRDGRILRQGNENEEGRDIQICYKRHLRRLPLANS